MLVKHIRKSVRVIPLPSRGGSARSAGVGDSEKRFLTDVLLARLRPEGCVGSKNAPTRPAFGRPPSPRVRGGGTRPNQCDKIFDRNFCARSLRGLPKKSSLRASSTIS